MDVLWGGVHCVLMSQKMTLLGEMMWVVGKGGAKKGEVESSFRISDERTKVRW